MDRFINIYKYCYGNKKTAPEKVQIVVSFEFENSKKTKTAHKLLRELPVFKNDNSYSIIIESFNAR